MAAPGLEVDVELDDLGERDLAEREGFEPPVELPPHLISNQAQSTRLCHLSISVIGVLLRVAATVVTAGGHVRS